MGSVAPGRRPLVKKIKENKEKWILDVEGDQETVGKTVGLDLQKGKLTLPMILLLDGSDSASFATAVEAFRSEDAGQILEMLRASDAIDRARTFAVEQVDAAVASITGLDLGDSEDQSIWNGRRYARRNKKHTP